MTRMWLNCTIELVLRAGYEPLGIDHAESQREIFWKLVQDRDILEKMT